MPSVEIPEGKTVYVLDDIERHLIVRAVSLFLEREKYTKFELAAADSVLARMDKL